jgi:hypothetical protein
MKTFIEHRRLRTWEADAAVDPGRSWRIILRYGLLRSLRSWWIIIPLIAVAVTIIFSIGAFSSELSFDPHGARASDVQGLVALYAMQGIVFLFLLGAPLFSEDLRFHAPLFYFSKPLKVHHYYLGKAGLLALFLAAVTILPVLILMLVGPAFGLPAQEPDPRHTSPLGLLEWRIAHLNSMGDWGYTMLVLVPAVVVLSAFFISITLLMSAFTRRAWHCAMAMVAIIGGWSLLGAIATEFTDTAFEHIFGPAGWVYLIMDLPMALRFGITANGAWGDPGRSYDAAAYVIVLSLTAAATWATLNRLRRQEAIL